MNMKITRRTKLLVVALALCFTTMIGSTLAWFTDSVESSGNKIESGTLDLQVLYQDSNNEWQDLEKTPTALFNSTLWEPGRAEVKAIEIKNNGTLALKYKVNFELTSASNDRYKLEDVIDVYMFATKPADRSAFIDAAKVGTLADLLYTEDNDGTVHGKLAGNATTGPLYIGLKMREEADNNYQNLNVGEGFNLVIVATQDMVENDSFGADYDADAEYPALSTLVRNIDELIAALAEGGNVKLANDIIATDNLTATKDTVIKLNGNKLTVSCFTINNNVKITLENGTLTGVVDKSYPAVIVKAGADVVLNDMKFVLEGSTTGLSGSPEMIPMHIDGSSVTMNGSSLVNEVNNPNGWNYGALVTNGTFTMNGGLIRVKNGMQVNEERSASIAFATGGVTTINYNAGTLDASRWFYSRDNKATVNSFDTTFDNSKCWTTNGGVLPTFNYINK